MTETSLDLELRPATLDDAPLAADLDTVREPQDPRDPVLMRHWFRSWDERERIARWISVRDGVALALVAVGHGEGMKFGWLRIRLHPDVWTAERFDHLIAFAEQWLRDEGASIAVFRCRAYLADEIAAVERLGYREVRRARISELDLDARRAHILATATELREKMREQGVELLTYSEYTGTDKAERLHRLETETEEDIPTTMPVPVLGFDQWKARRFEDPGVREDRMWIAVERDEIVGISQLGFPVLRGVPHTDYTATARSVRGRGIARALKYQTMAQAIELGFTLVRTQNDAANAPILHINQEMGYRLAFQDIELHRELDEK